MGSVTGYIECPRCKSEDCISDFYYKSGEEVIICFDCGYSKSELYKRDEQGSLIKKDDSKGFGFDNLIMEIKEIKNPYGSLKIETTGGGSTLTILEEEEDYNNFKKDILSSAKYDDKIQEVVVSRLVGDKIEKEVIYKKQ